MGLWVGMGAGLFILEYLCTPYTAITQEMEIKYEMRTSGDFLVV